MAEITPNSGFEGVFNPLPVGSEGAIAAPFVAVVDLIDFTKDEDFDRSIFYGIFVRTNGNADVDSAAAPGGTLRYADREFSNVQVSFNQDVHFPPVPHVVFPPDDFEDGSISPAWEWFSTEGLSFREKDGVLNLGGIPQDSGADAFTSVPAKKQNVTVEMDLRSPSRLQSNTPFMFRLQFDPFNYLQIQVDNDGYRLIRVVANEVDAVGDSLPLFGDEASAFHRLKLSYRANDDHVEAYVDDTRLDGVSDKVFSTSFAAFRLALYSFVAKDQYIEREWDDFLSVGSQAPVPPTPVLAPPSVPDVAAAHGVTDDCGRAHRGIPGPAYRCGDVTVPRPLLFAASTSLPNRPLTTAFLTRWQGISGSLAVVAAESVQRKNRIFEVRFAASVAPVLKADSGS